MAKFDRAGNAYGSPAKSATNAQRGMASNDPFVGQGVTWGIGESGRTWDGNDRSRWKQDPNSLTNSKTSKNWKMQDKTTYGNEVSDTKSPWADPNRQTADGKMLPGLSPFGD